MKRSIFLLSIVLVGSDVLCRVPDNLIGTDIFPDEMNVTVSQKTGKDTLRDVPVTLPTKALNLSYGAECFTVCCQPLYQFGDLHELDEQGTAAEDGEEEAVPDDADEGADVDDAVRGTVVRINNFYKDISQEEKLTYAECNPLAILVRALFWQNPGTSGLADFRVAKSCIVSDASGRDDFMATMQCWADVVTVAMNLYQIRDVYAGAKAIDRVNVLYKTFSKQRPPHPIMITALEQFPTNVAKPNMVQLLFDCITWSEANALGKDFPVRVLMGAVYALAGHDKGLIAIFYQALQQKMAAMMPAAATDTAWPVVAERVEQYAKGATDPAPDSPASRACALFKLYRGIFSPIAYGNAIMDGQSFADCFDTMTRNILLALLLNKDESFRAGVASAKVDEFLAAYPSIAAQESQAARNAWAQLISRIPGAVYVRAGGYELEPTLVNMLFMLNYLFNLGIADFDDGFIGRVIPVAGDGVFIQAVLPKVNEALATKLGLETTAEPLVEVTDIDTVSDLRYTNITCVIHAPFIKLQADISCYGHGEVDVERSLMAYEGTGEFSFLERAMIGLPSSLNAGSNLVLLSARLERDKVAPFIAACKEQLGLLHMLYALAGWRCDFDPDEYGRWLIEGVNVGIWIGEAVQAAQQGLHSPESHVQQAAINVFKALVVKDQGFGEAIQAAREGMHSSDTYVQREAISLFEALVTKNQGLEEAIQVAVDGMMSSDVNIYHPVFNLFKALFAKEQGFDKATQLAVDGTKSSDARIRCNAFELFKELFAHGKGFDEAAEVAVAGMNSSDHTIYSGASHLFRLLFAHGKGFDQAAQLAVDGMKSSDRRGSYLANELFSQLFANGQGFAEAKALFTEASFLQKKRNFKTRHECDQLEALLKKYGQSVD